MLAHKVLFYLEIAREGFWKYLLGPALGTIATHEGQFINRTRTAVSCFVAIAFALLFYSIFASSPLKFINLAGVTFDIAGALRLFISEQVDEWLEPYKDEEKYPYGPPSYVMRELIVPDASPYNAGDVPPLWHTYFHKRGVLYLIVGFSLQFLASAFS